MAATFATAKLGPSPMRTCAPSPLVGCVPRISLSNSAMAQAAAPPSAPCQAARTWRVASSRTVTASTAQIEPSA